MTQFETINSMALGTKTLMNEMAPKRYPTSKSTFISPSNLLLSSYHLFFFPFFVNLLKGFYFILCPRAVE